MHMLWIVLFWFNFYFFIDFPSQDKFESQYTTYCSHFLS